MKKVFLPAALALAVAGSWAFYPKADEPSGYTMVVARINYQEASILTIMSDGKKTIQPVGTHLYSSSEKSSAAFETLHEAELQKINSLHATGWKVIEISQSRVAAASDIAETVYVLEK